MEAGHDNGNRQIPLRRAAGRGAARGGTEGGVLIRTLDGNTVFRVYDSPERFTDYEIRHDDLSVTIHADALAAFYKVGERDILDHDPRVLGLRKINEP
jgi:hypothetical protein